MIKGSQLYGVYNKSLLVNKYLLQRRLDSIPSAVIQSNKLHLICYDHLLSHYYCTHDTISMSNQLFKLILSEIDLFRIFSL
ncbi:unnamed protein product [Rotaria sp. Silwood1]|nr:unnamed protein product [Rotaria sp. Silwood1]CAF3433978.1 unnamed protein product [Rotaria sp. Silwood1]CAF4536499.1 unnamed protein product [Rotaria sp. Silwood1]CAF4678080.1 unnamed protein product [Rotaria sp. Silwood1]